MTEGELIAAAKAGDQDAFTELYARYISCVKATIRSIMRSSDIDDLCQETFLLAFTRLDSFRGNSNFRTWITRIAMNQCLMTLRRNRQVTNGASQLLQLDEQDISDELLDQCIFSSEDRNLRAASARFDVEKALQSLRPKDRLLLELSYFCELSNQEIAERLEMTLASVVSGKFHAKRKAKKYLQQPGKEYQRNASIAVDPPQSKKANASAAAAGRMTVPEFTV